MQWWGLEDNTRKHRKHKTLRWWVKNYQLQKNLNDINFSFKSQRFSTSVKRPYLTQGFTKISPKKNKRKTNS